MNTVEKEGMGITLEMVVVYSHFYPLLPLPSSSLSLSLFGRRHKWEGIIIVTSFIPNISLSPSSFYFKFTLHLCLFSLLLICVYSHLFGSS